MGKSLVAVNAGPRVKWNTDTLINETRKAFEEIIVGICDGFFIQ